MEPKSKYMKEYLKYIVRKMKIGRIVFWLCLVLIPMLLPEFIAFVVPAPRCYVDWEEVKYAIWINLAVQFIPLLELPISIVALSRKVLWASILAAVLFIVYLYTKFFLISIPMT